MELVQESISITPNEIEELYKNISKTYHKILDLDDYYKNKKGFHIHKIQKNKIFNLDDLTQVKSLEEIEIVYPFGTALLKNSIVYSCFKKEQYYASPSILHKHGRRFFVYFPVVVSSPMIPIACNAGFKGDIALASYGSILLGSILSTGFILADLFSKKNTFEHVADQIKTNTIERSKSINQYLSRHIDPEKFFKKEV